MSRPYRQRHAPQARPFRPALELLESRVLPTTTYSLSSAGVLSQLTDGVTTTLLYQVQSFAVDGANDVFALGKNSWLMVKGASAPQFLSGQYGIAAFGLDLDHNELVVAKTDTSVAETPIDSQLLTYGSGTATYLGAPGFAAADGSLWFLGSTNNPSAGSPIFQLKGGHLTQLPSLATSLAPLEGTVYEFANNRVSSWNGSAWALQPSLALNYEQIDFLGNANADGRGNHTFYQWYGSPYAVSGGPVGVNLSSGGDGGIYVQDTSGGVSGYNPSIGGSAWQKLATVTSPDGARFFLGLSNISMGDGSIGHTVGRWVNGTVTAPTFSYASSLAIAGGTLWAHAYGGQVWGWNGTAWVQQTTTATAGDGSLWFLGLKKLDAGGDRGIFYYAFDQVAQAPGQAVRLTGSGGTVTATSVAGSAQHWTAAPHTPATVRAGDGSLFALVQGVLWRQAQAGTAWKVYYADAQLVTTFQLDASGNQVYWLTGDRTVRTAGLSSGSNYQLAGFTGLVAPDHSLWYIGPNFSVDRLARGQLASIAGSAFVLAVVENTVVAQAPSSGQTFAWNGTALVALPSTGASSVPTFLGLANADGRGNHTAYQWDNHGNVVALPVRGIALVSYNDLFVRDTTGQLWTVHQGVASKTASVTQADGSILFLGLTADSSRNFPVYQWAGGTISWRTSAIALFAADGTVWAITAGNGVLRWDGSTWVYLPSASAPDGSAWFVGTANVDALGNHAIYRFAGRSLARLPGKAVVVVVAGSEVVTVDASNQGWSWTGTATGSWKPLTSLAAADGSLWLLGVATDAYHEHAVYRYAGGTLRTISAAVRLALVDGLVWQAGVGSGGVYQWNGTASTALTSTVAPDGSLWVLGPDADANGNRPLYRWTGAQPGLMPGAATGLVATQTDLWMADAAGLAWKWDGKEWTSQRTGVKQLAPSGAALYALLQSGQVARFDKSGWTTIADQALPAPDGSYWFLNNTEKDANGNRTVYRLLRTGVYGSFSASALTIAEGTAWIVIPNGEVLSFLPNGTWTGPGIIPDGTGRAQWFVDHSAKLYLVSNGKTLYSAAPTGFTKLADNVAPSGAVLGIAQDAAGEIVLVDASGGYTYLIGDFAVGGGAIDAHGDHAEYALDAKGRLYQLLDGVLTVAASSADSFHPVTTGVTQIVTSADGELMALKGPSTYEIYDGTTFVIGASGNFQLYFDAAGRSFFFDNGTVTVSDGSTTTQVATNVVRLFTNSSRDVFILKQDGTFSGFNGIAPFPLGAGAVLESDGSVWFISTTDLLAVNAIYQFASGVFNAEPFSTPALFAKWMALGGPASSIGTPLADPHVGNGYVWQTFQHGYLYTVTSSPGVGVAVVAGLANAIADRWFAMSGPQGALGLPVGTLQSDGRWLWQDFAGGRILTDLSQVYAVSGTIWSAYQQNTALLGKPTADVSDGDGFQWQTFTGGGVYAPTGGTAHALLGSATDPSTFWGKFVQLGSDRGLGLPTSDLTDLGKGFVFQDFQSGVLYWSAATGTHGLPGNPSDPSTIWGRWAQLGFEQGPLGLPISDEEYVDNAGNIQPTGPTQANDAMRVVKFQHGFIYWSAITGARVVSDTASANDLPPALGLTDGAAGAIGDEVHRALTTKIDAYDFTTYTHLSLNLMQGTLNGDLEIAGVKIDTGLIAQWLNGNYQVPQLDLVKAVQFVTHQEDDTQLTQDYNAHRDQVYTQAGNGDKAVGADTVYFCSERFARWASPQTLARFAVEIYYGQVKQVIAEVKNEVALELKNMLAWVMRKFDFNDPRQAEAQLQDLFTGVAHATVKGGTFSMGGTPHFFFQVNLPDSDGLTRMAPQIKYLDLASAGTGAATGVASDFAQNYLENLGKDLLNTVFGTQLDPSNFDFSASLGDQAVNAALSVAYGKLLDKMGITPPILTQLYSQQGGVPVLDLLQWKNSAGTPIFGAAIHNFLDAPLSKIYGNAGSVTVQSLQLNLSTYELTIRVAVRFRQSWGSVQDILDRVGGFFQKAGQNAPPWLSAYAAKAVVWCEQEGGALASWYHDNILKPLDGGPPPPPPPWMTDALAKAKALGGPTLGTIATEAGKLSADNIGLSKIADALPGLPLTGDNTITVFG